MNAMRFMEAGPSILDTSIDEQKGNEGQSVGEFIDGVEDRVDERITQLRVVHGDAVRQVTDKVTKELDSYRRSKLRLYDPDFKVKDTERKGAIAWNEKGGDNSIALGESMMDREGDEEYQQRVITHELTHQLEQASEFNLSQIWYPGETLEVIPVLVEWHAITAAQQPDSDLTPEYISYKRRGEAFVQFLGSAEPIIAALKSGDMRTLQAHILKKVRQPEREAA